MYPVQIQAEGAQRFFAGRCPTVLGAKAGSLPYRLARMEMNRKNQTVDFTSSRIFKHAEFSAVYQPVSDPIITVPGSLNYWLLERYCLFTKWGKWVLRGDIRHERWKVSEADAVIKVNTVFPINLMNDPSLAHYSSKKTAFFVRVKRVLFK